MDTRAVRFARRRLVLALAVVVLTGCTGREEPIAVLTAAVITGAAPLEIAFDLSYSVCGENGSATYELDFGDASDSSVGSDLGVVVHHTYGAGTYDAVLILTDARGQQDSDTLTITADASGPPVGTSVGDTAPDFTAHTTGGGSLTLYDHRGEVILLDFWGAWCAPCRKSMPHLDALIREYADNGVVAVVISTDAAEQTSIDFLEDGGYDAFLSVWEPGGKSGSPLTELYGLNGTDVGIPCTFVIDRQGVIRYVGHPLDLTAEMLEAIL
ncbi:MAG: redoxin domain-containing protein [Candidatus Bipolaricaulota bacterium]|nr:redoxin domain-containing protein [Candidatus Bipolaricaulota bacterium]